MFDFSDELKEVIYLPTLRCNYKCKSCYTFEHFREEEEVNCADIAQSLLSSKCAQSLQRVNISGGEPFLKKDLKEFVRLMNQAGVFQSITTNGYYIQSIEEICQMIPNKELVYFAVSIDGIGETHNKIRGNQQAYQRALKTVELLKKYDIPFVINTVIQEDNIDQIEDIQEELRRLEVQQTIIPEVNYHGKNHYTDIVYSSKIYPYLHTKMDQKYVLSQAEFALTDCHSGIQNVTIGPNGDIALCVVKYQNPRHKRASVIIGNLGEQNLDAIFCSGKRQETFQRSIQTCGRNTGGCYGACELDREFRMYHLDIQFTRKELDRLKQLMEVSSAQYPSTYFVENWHETENYEWGSLRWMSDKRAVLFYTVTVDNPQKLSITYINNLDGLALSLQVDGMPVMERYILEQTDTLEFYLEKHYKNGMIIEIDFEVDRTWRPCDLSQTPDNRTLGIAVADIFVC